MMLVEIFPMNRGWFPSLGSEIGRSLPYRTDFHTTRYGLTARICYLLTLWLLPRPIIQLKEMTSLTQ